MDMIVIAHAGHWALGLLQATPVFAVAAVALWRSRVSAPTGLRGRQG
jgi:hypothetical protein